MVLAQMTRPPGNGKVAPGYDTIMVGSSSRSLPLRARVAQGGARGA